MGDARGDPSPELQQPAGLEASEDHDDAAIEDEGESTAATAKPAVRGALQRNQNERADQRSIERAGAAERRDDDHLHGDEDAESTFGIHEAQLESVERARGRRERGAQHEGLEL